MCGAGAPQLRPLIAPASCPGSSITAAGMWAAWGPRGSITSAPLFYVYLLSSPNQQDRSPNTTK